MLFTFGFVVGGPARHFKMSFILFSLVVLFFFILFYITVINVIIIIAGHQVTNSCFLPEILLLSVDFRAATEVWWRSDGTQQLRQKQSLNKSVYLLLIQRN